MAELKSVVIQALVSEKAELQKLLQDNRPHKLFENVESPLLQSVGQAVFETREAVQGKPLKLPTTACLRCVLREVDHHFLGKLTGDTTLSRPQPGYVEAASILHEVLTRLRRTKVQNMRRTKVPAIDDVLGLEDMDEESALPNEQAAGVPALADLEVESAHEPIHDAAGVPATVLKRKREAAEDHNSILPPHADKDIASTRLLSALAGASSSNDAGPFPVGMILEQLELETKLKEEVENASNGRESESETLPMGVRLNIEDASNSEYSYYSYSESESESTESESESTTSSYSYYSDDPAKPATHVLKMAYAIPPADVSKQLACGADEEDDEDNPNVKIAKVCAAKKLEDTACACPTPEKTTATGEPKSYEKTTAAKPVGKAKSKSQRPTATRSAYMQFMKNYFG